MEAWMKDAPLQRGVFRSWTPKVEELIALEEALRSRSGDSECTIALSDLLLFQGRFQEAEAGLRKVASSENRIQAAIALIKLGMLLENLGHVDEAEAALREAVDCHQKADVYLAEFLQWREESGLGCCRVLGMGYDGQHCEAYQAILQTPCCFLEHVKHLWFSDVRLGFVYLARGDKKRAEHHLGLAYGEPRTHAFVALYLKRKGEVRDVFYRQVDANDPVALRNARRSLLFIIQASQFACDFKHLLQEDRLGLLLGQMEIAALWGKLTSQSREQVEEVSDVLHRLYADPWRKYHNLNHVKDCLNQLAEFKAKGGGSHEACDEIAVAIWFHDAVYDTSSGENEHKSAELFNTRSQGMDPSVRSRIEGMILATKDHVARNDMEQVMLDIDLSILGRCAAEFDEYDAAIRAEYSWVPEDVYRHNRAEVLQSFLDRERIFHTQHFFERFEGAARSNLNRAIARLTDPFSKL